MTTNTGAGRYQPSCAGGILLEVEGGEYDVESVLQQVLSQLSRPQELTNRKVQDDYYTVIPILNGLGEKGSENIRLLVATVLRKLAESRIADEESIKVLNLLVEEGSNAAALESMKALGLLAGLDIGDSSSLPIINVMLVNEDPKMRLAAAEAIFALTGIGVVDDTLNENLNRLLADEDDTIVVTALRDLIRIFEAEQGDIDTLELLHALITTRSIRVAKLAITLVDRIAVRISTSSQFIVELNPFLDSEDMGAAGIAAACLGNMAKHCECGNETSIPGLVRLGNRGSTNARVMAIYAIAHLTSIGVADESCVDLVRIHLDDVEEDVRTIAAHAVKNLAENGRGSLEFIEGLNRNLEETDETVVSNSAWALQALAKNGFSDDSSKELLESLVEYSGKDDVVEAAQAALEALAECELRLTPS